MKASFEEKQYETAANAELALSNPAVYAPGQVAEAILGFDVATKQDVTASIWNLLQLGAPAGVVLTPNFWSGAPKVPADIYLPTFYVSLILQYKRAEFMKRSNSQAG